MEVVVQTATLDEVLDIATLVESHAKRNLVLPRSTEEIHDTIKDWVVVLERGKVIACGSLLGYSPALSEIRSLVVDDRFKRNGMGIAVVEALIAEARRRGVRTLFSLTRKSSFFKQIGFHNSEKSRFPEKAWRDCKHCPILMDCDRITVELSLDEETDGTFAS